MTERKPQSEGRVLKSIKLGDFELLSDEKVGRAVDQVEGISPILKSAVVNGQKREVVDDNLTNAIGKLPKDKAIITLYDRLGGAIRFEKRKVALGTFFDFESGLPQENIEIKEDVFEDQYVLVRKQKVSKRVQGEDIRRKVANLTKSGKSDEDAEELAGTGVDSAPKKRGRKPKAE